MSDPLDLSLARLQRWRRVQRGLDGVLPAIAAACGVAATAVMVVRLGLPALAWTVWPLAAANAAVSTVIGAELLWRHDHRVGAIVASLLANSAMVMVARHNAKVLAMLEGR